jgi:hypothetical protein
MKLSIIFLLISAVLIASVASQPKKFAVLPCVLCSGEYKPVCAKPNKGGPPKTFGNRCLVKVEDCGKTERRELEFEDV